MLNPLKPRLLGQQATACEQVLTESQTSRLLVREKARTDRSHIPFSTLRLTGDFRTIDGKERFERLVEHCRSRLRITDDLGWLSEHEMAVVMPATGTQGAECVAENIEDRFAGEFGIEVYTYPGNWWIESLREQTEGAGLPHRAEGRTTVAASDSGNQLVEEVEVTPSRSSSLASIPMELMMVRPLPRWKRLMDVAGAGVGLLLLSPILLLVALLVRTTSSGPACYAQRRSGLGGRPFTIYKFRSMVVDADAQKHLLTELNEQDGPAFKIKNDPRVTAVGRFIRKTSLDELPQLWNVLRGDMSLVGPRPLPCHETAGCEPWHLERLRVTPGLTCIWQVYGRSQVTFDEWMRMDLRYIRTMSVRQDIKLIVATAWRMIFKKNGV